MRLTCREQCNIGGCLALRLLDACVSDLFTHEFVMFTGIFVLSQPICMVMLCWTEAKEVMRDRSVLGSYFSSLIIKSFVSVVFRFRFKI